MKGLDQQETKHWPFCFPPTGVAASHERNPRPNFQSGEFPNAVWHWKVVEHFAKIRICHPR
jgi:hypothetical protein